MEKITSVKVNVENYYIFIWESVHEDRNSLIDYLVSEEWGNITTPKHTLETMTTEVLQEFVKAVWITKAVNEQDKSLKKLVDDYNWLPMNMFPDVDKLSAVLTHCPEEQEVYEVKEGYEVVTIEWVYTERKTCEDCDNEFTIGQTLQV